MVIDGHTAVILHLANPAAHLQTPQRLNPRCVERGINAVLVPWQVQPEDLAQMMGAMRRAESLRGAIVTIPHKESSARLCDRLEGVADVIKVANVIRREADGTLTGRILDGDGFVGGLRDANVQIAGKSILIVGAGGVALAIAAALIEADIAQIKVYNRTPERADAMISRLRDLSATLGKKIHLDRADSADPTGFDIALNATALGMHEGDALPIPPEKITSEMVIAEVVMRPAVTELLHAAKARGAKIIPGGAMIAGQLDPLVDFIMASPAANR